MNGSKTSRNEHDLDKVIAMAEALLIACDDQGLMFAAIDISSALDKLRKVRNGESTG